MSYTNKNIKDIPNWLECPFCWDYRTKIRTNLEKHFKKCEELAFQDTHPDDAESQYLDETTSVGDYIEQELSAIELTKQLIKSNELDAIKAQTPNEIRNYIKNKLEEKSTHFTKVEFNVINIYEFFFGRTEESENIWLEHMEKVLTEHI